MDPEVQQALDKLDADVSAAVFKVLASSSKIPFTNDGIALVSQAISDAYKGAGLLDVQVRPSHWGQPSVHRLPAIRIAGRELSRFVLGDLAVRHVVPPAGCRTNRHWYRRWMRGFAAVASVAEDAMMEGNRPRAIEVLCSAIGVYDAVAVTSEPRTRWDDMELKVTMTMPVQVHQVTLSGIVEL